MIGSFLRQSSLHGFHSYTRTLVRGKVILRRDFGTAGSFKLVIAGFYTRVLIWSRYTVMSDVEDDEFLQGESEGEESVKDEEEQEEEEEKEEEEPVAKHEEQVETCTVTQEMVEQGLSLLCRTGNGLSHAFVKLDLKERRLTDLTLLTSFVHLRFLDISSNLVSDLSPLTALTQLLWLKGDGNVIQRFEGQPLGQLAYLQWLSLALNRICDLKGLGGPSLESINLIGNSIERVTGLEYSRLTNLVTLELRGNRLESTDGIYLPNLRKLYLAQNGIKRLEGLDRLEHLTTLHLRDNQLETLDGINSNMKALQYLNIRGNQVSSPRALVSLVEVMNTLKSLVLTENPLSEIEDYRLFVLSRLPMLERLDKEQITPEEREETKERHGELENEEDLE
ncbi:leucine-rich repeat-containing protein 23 isoform X1 [Conger conger]|uniref:leucine-rich repeat-containing protein 23 isoform X1 n=2 Tax=Conger conger TaxID=82655 RepID=UPI002A59CFB5|nr:leucine-rich repeat-containing protein 23 isoform X1 [Conger conger]